MLLLRAGPAADGARAGLSLCAGLVVPSLFPFMALSIFICESPASRFFGRLTAPITKLLRLPESAGAVLLAAAVGGYPSAAKCLAEAVKSGAMERRTAERMLSFCVNAGPPFLISAVGVGIFGSASIGAVLLAAQAVSAILIAAVGALMSKESPPSENATRDYPPISVCATRAVTLAAGAAFNMCAFIVIFSSALELLRAAGAFDMFSGSPLALALSSGFFEVTSGCALCAGLPGYAGPVAAAALASFSGVSVMGQIAGAVEGSGIDLRAFLLSRLPHAALSAALCRLLLGLFPEAVESLARFGGGVSPSTSVSAPAVVSLLCMTALFLLSLIPENSKYSIEKVEQI